METKLNDVKKVCYYCIHGRPLKKNLCSIHRYYVKDVYSHTCDQFSVDRWLVEAEKRSKDEQPQNDEGSLLVLLMAA